MHGRLSDKHGNEDEPGYLRLKEAALISSASGSWELSSDGEDEQQAEDGRIMRLVGLTGARCDMDVDGTEISME